MLRELIYEIFKFIGDLNYWHVALLSALESTAFPVIIPVETIVIPMGYYAYLGTKSLPLLIISCTIGIVVGCLVNYAFARYLGRSFIYKHAKFLHINVEKLQKLEEKFLRHGRLLMFVGRFVPIPAFKHIITIPAGMAKMPVYQFIFYNALGGLIFSASMLLIGYFFGSSEELWRQALGRFVMVCLALFGIYLLIRFIITMLIRRSNKNSVSLQEFAVEDEGLVQRVEGEKVNEENDEIFIGNYKIKKGKTIGKNKGPVDYNASRKVKNRFSFFSKKNGDQDKDVKGAKKTWLKNAFSDKVTKVKTNGQKSLRKVGSGFKKKKFNFFVKQKKSRS